MESRWDGTLQHNDVSRVQFLSFFLRKNQLFFNASSQKASPSAKLVELTISKPKTTFLDQVSCKNVLKDVEFLKVLIIRAGQNAVECETGGDA